MKYTLFILLILILFVPALAQEDEPEESPGEFYISKVNRVEKVWVIPPNRLRFMGSYGITQFDYLRLLPPEEQGEHYVISWRYRGEELDKDLTLKFEYRTVSTPEEFYTAEYVWPKPKGGNYKWTFKNVGANFSKKGKVDRWKVLLIDGDKVVAEKKSFTWHAMEGT